MPRSLHPAALLAVASLVLALTGCSIDDRPLRPGTGGDVDLGGGDGDVDAGDGDADADADVDADSDADADSDGDADGDADLEPVCWREPVDTAVSLADLEQGFDGGNWLETVLGVLERRYPSGHDLLVEMQGDSQMAGFAETSSFASLMESMMTIVHEETHGWDYEHASGADRFSYWLSSDVQIQVPWVQGFERSELYGLLEDDSTSLYSDTYLTGEQGTYGFVELLDEMNCYINGLAALAVVGEYEEWGISARDGALAFLYYLELYLGRARAEYPDLYADLQAEPSFVQLVESQWLRAHFFLELTANVPALGIADDDIAPHVYADANRQEIELFIGKPVAASSCLP